MATSPALVPRLGTDGIAAADVPILAFTEKVLEEKEQQLRKYIQDNYSKIQNVERELSSLALEVKLTAGPRKAALEHLRRKIELCTEKIKAAKQKEEHARKVWEVAAKVLKEEEEFKHRLCEDLSMLVQESVTVQHARLEELKQRLEALNPVLGGRSIHTTNLESGSRTETSAIQQEVDAHPQQVYYGHH
eukprot:c28388_g2_i1 orf=347-916(-)